MRISSKALHQLIREEIKQLREETDEEWAGLVRAMEAPDWATGTGLETHDGRLESIGSIHEQLANWTADFDDQELAARLQGAGV